MSRESYLDIVRNDKLGPLRSSPPPLSLLSFSQLHMHTASAFLKKQATLGADDADKTTHNC
jgi:hypothetical protein